MAGVMTAEEVISLAELHADLTGRRTFIVVTAGELAITTDLPETFLECIQPRPPLWHEE
jgi:hypothetical protein